ncbi:C6 zinc finger domain-containing protein [Stagonosporopsis vannaccii]|nr:C6 zinc finger domain-containing protein [Stagonosporopsis vannaccii]
METSASASAEGADCSATARPKRSRTGCMTCRNRRRKCDEGKPTCQNCISKGFECRYAAAFQILGKHNFTPEVKVGVKYANVRFAGDESQDLVPEVANQQETLDVSPQNDGFAQPQHVIFPERQGSKDAINSNNRSCPGHTPSPNSYEFALHGLLALGSTSGVVQEADNPQTAAVSGDQSISMFDFATNSKMDPASDSRHLQERPELRRTGTSQSSALGFNMTSHGTPGPSPGLLNLNTSTNLNRSYDTDSDALVSSERTPTQAVLADSGMELLKFYRYNIAPWLDICDADQHFGVTLLTELHRSPVLRSRIMQLALAASSNSWISKGQSVDDSIVNGPFDGSVTLDAIEDLVASVLKFLAEMIPNLAASWLRGDGPESRRHFLERLLLESGSSRLMTCAYWLLVRLELSHTLMAGNSRISLPHLNAESGAARSNDPVAQCAYDVIGLCVDTAMFAQGDDDRWLQQRYGLNRVEVWKALVQDFAYWYMHRSQAFQPIIELYPRDGVLADDDYPTIVFTSGAALLANQLYHTGMLLLLQNRPRFADKPSQNSPSMSTLWHAHRICGIAIQNDRPGWWDPCLVASLIVAGRTATHTSQHSAIVRTLESVQRLTGWVIEPYVEQLRTEWQLAEEWQEDQGRSLAL